MNTTVEVVVTQLTEITTIKNNASRMDTQVTTDWLGQNKMSA